MTANVRNVAIIVALAVGVAFLPGGGTAGGFVLRLLSILVFVGVALVAVRLYREQRVTLRDLPGRDRVLLYGAAGVAIWTLTATHRLWSTGVGIVIWFVLLAAAGYSVYAVFRAARQY